MIPGPEASGAEPSSSAPRKPACPDRSAPGVTRTARRSPPGPNRPERAAPGSGTDPFGGPAYGEDMAVAGPSLPGVDQAGGTAARRCGHCGEPPRVSARTDAVVRPGVG